MVIGFSGKPAMAWGVITNIARTVNGNTKNNTIGLVFLISFPSFCFVWCRTATKGRGVFNEDPYDNAGNSLPPRRCPGLSFEGPSECLFLLLELRVNPIVVTFTKYKNASPPFYHDFKVLFLCEFLRDFNQSSKGTFLVIIWTPLCIFCGP